MSDCFSLFMYAMRHFMILAWAALILGFNMNSAEAGGNLREGCQWPHPIGLPHVDYGADLRSFIIDLPDARLDDLESWPIANGLQDYRDWVLAHLDPSPATHARLIRDAGALDRPLNGRLLGGEFGTVRPARCLERLLLELHHQFVPLTTRSAEFRAWVLKREGRLRVFFATHPLEAWGPNLPTTTRLSMEADLRAGWTLAFDLHNHPFDFDQPCGPGGAGGFIAPSPMDLTSYTTHAGDSRTEYRVTNGFYTGILSLAEAVEEHTREGQWHPARECRTSSR